MRLHAENDDQIPRSSTVWRRLPISFLANVAVGIHACGNVERHRRLLALGALSLTFGALLANDLTRTAAIGAGHLTNGAPEHRILHLLHDSSALTLSAGRERRAVLRTRAATACARFVSRVAERLLATLRRVHERKRHFPLNILADERTTRTRATAAETAAENTAENIRDILKARAAAKAAETAHAAHTGMLKLVIVRRTFLLVGKRLVRLVDLLEPLRRLFVAGVAVGVVFHRELSVRRFNFLGRRLFVHAEYFVIILLICHISYLYSVYGFDICQTRFTLIQATHVFDECVFTGGIPYRRCPYRGLRPAHRLPADKVSQTRAVRPASACRKPL